MVLNIIVDAKNEEDALDKAKKEVEDCVFDDFDFEVIDVEDIE